MCREGRAARTGTEEQYISGLKCNRLLLRNLDDLVDGDLMKGPWFQRYPFIDCIRIVVDQNASSNDTFLCPFLEAISDY